MYEDTKVSQLVINHLTEEKFKELLENDELDQNQLYMTDDNVGYTPPLLDFKWADHLLNDISWLRADTFSWQSGDVYVAAYNHLASEMHIENLYAWQEEESRNVYTKSATPSVGDSVYRTGGGLYGTVQSVGTDNITVNGMNFPRNSGGDILGTNAETDTVDGITITFYRAEDGHKICLPDQEDKILALYNATGVAWYYILDTANKQFKLPRTKFGFTGLRDEVGGYVPESLPNIRATSSNNNVFKGSGGSFTGAFVMRDGNNEGIYGSGNGTYFGVDFDASLSSPTYQDNAPVQERATQTYLYFYVGNFERDAVEQTAGVTTETLNSKLDIGAGNATPEGKATVVGWGIPDYSAGISLSGWQATNTNFTVPCAGYIQVFMATTGGALETFYIDDIPCCAIINSFTQYTGNAVGGRFIEGGVHTFRSSAPNRTYSVIFYPCKGVL